MNIILLIEATPNPIPTALVETPVDHLPDWLLTVLALLEWALLVFIGIGLAWMWLELAGRLWRHLRRRGSRPDVTR